MGSRLDAGSNFEKAWLKSRKMLRKRRQNCRPGTPLGAHWGSEGRAREALGTVCTSLWRLRVVFLTICLEKCDFEISMPFCSRIATFARLGDQVGATRAQKSRSSSPKLPRTSKREGPGQSSQSGRFGLAVGVIELRRKSGGNRAGTTGNQIGQNPKSI